MTIDANAQRDALAERLFGATLGAMDLFAVYLGDRLGFYRALAERPLTSRELADRTATNERYAREWLEQQAVTGILDASGGDADTRRFALSPGHAEVLTDPNNLAAMVPLARFLAGIAGVLPELLDAYRTGAGVPCVHYGLDGREGQAGMTRPLFVNLLGDAWLPAVPDLDARLRADPPAAVADVGCGAGWSSVAIARAYPNARVDGFDLDAASIDLARANAEQAGVGDRVSFQVRDAGDPALAGRYDLVCAFECIHDMANPVAAIGVMRQLAGAGGAIVIADEKVAERFTAPGDDIERFMYGFSILHCLPVGLAEQPSAGTGAVMRETTLRRYATEAGCRAVEVLPIAHDWWRFYRLTA
jgi:2-polyprenyl-3-methyl-5-hydroxy-6-metoxy-1,4-benzoquinol methylase